MFKKNHIFFIFAVALMSIVGMLSSDIYLPAMPTMVSYFDTTINIAQSTLSVFLLGFSISQLWWGPFCDRFGRKFTILVQLVIYIASSIGCVFAGNIEMLILFRFFQSLGASTGMVTRVVINDMYGQAGTAAMLAIVFPIIAISPAISPLLGGWLTYVFGWRGSFIFMVIFGITLFIIAWFTLDETLPNPTSFAPGVLMKNYFSILVNAPFVSYSILTCAAYAAYFAYLVKSPFVFAELGYGPMSIGFFYIGLSFSYIIGNWLGRWLSAKVLPINVLKSGVFIFCIGGILMCVSNGVPITSPWQLIAPISVMIIGNGFILPFGISGAIGSVPGLAGLASGMLGFLQLGSAALGVKAISGFGSFAAIQLPHVMVISCCVSIVALLLISFYDLKRYKLV